jgi:DNA-binding IclR family transcriptional regulator
VLEAVAFSNDELGVTQIADRLGVAKGSVYRHLSTLVDRGYLNQNAVTARYSVGPKSRVLARIAPETDLAQIAEGPMRDLRDRIGQTVVLSSLTPRGALVIFAVPGTSPIEIGVRPGSELSFHASAQGKVLMAFSPHPLQQRVLSRGLTKLTDKTIVDRQELERELLKVQKQGYAAAPEEALLGINAIAAPVFDRQDAVIAAVALVGSIQFLPATPELQMISALKECCEQISRRLGHGRGDGAPYPAARGRR